MRPGHHDVREPLFDAEWVKPGALVVSMASAQCTPEFVRSARVVATNWYVMAEETKPKSPYDVLIPEGAFKPDDLTELGRSSTARPTRGARRPIVCSTSSPAATSTTSSSPPGATNGRAPQGLGHTFDLRA